MWRWLIEVPSKWLHRFAALVLLPILAAVVAADVVARYVFHAPLEWAHDVSAVTLLSLFVAAIPITTVRDGHIRMETFYERFGVRGRALSDLFSNLFAIMFLGLIGYWQLLETRGMYERSEGAQMVNLPYWPFALFTGLCATYVVLILLIRAAVALRTVVTGVTGVNEVEPQ